MLLALSVYCVYRNSLNQGILHMRIYLSNGFLHIKEYRDYGKTRKITHNHGNNINSIGTHMRKEILQACIFPFWFGNSILFDF